MAAKKRGFFGQKRGARPGGAVLRRGGLLRRFPSKSKQADIDAGPCVRYALVRCWRNGCTVHRSAAIWHELSHGRAIEEGTASRLTIRRPTMSNILKSTRSASILIFAAPVLIVALLASGSRATAQTSVSPARMKAIEICIAQARSQARGTMGGRRRHRELLYASCMYSKGQRP